MIGSGTIIIIIIIIVIIILVRKQRGLPVHMYHRVLWKQTPPKPVLII